MATVRAPEIDLPGLQWFNVAHPLSIEGLRGKIVILDFWTFCCINCMQILPTLRRVEEAFPEEVAVIGVHSPKFQAERDPGNVARAIARYDIRHPVVHDPDFRIWRQYAVRAWPTLTFIDAEGRVLGNASGEPDPDRLMTVVRELVEQARSGGALRPSLLPLQEPANGAGRLSFPGKIKPLPRADGVRHWAIADGGHHQIVVADDAGRELTRIGAGEPGFADGDLATARFNGPQGLACAPDVIYVADTGNHAIRRIDMTVGRVATLAGTGRRGAPLGQPAAAAETALASPWDLALDGERLYVANAGTHQLGLLHLGRGTVERLAGSGGEDIVDGPAAEALLAQPSGLALSPDRGTLYFVDSETSSVRAIELGPRPMVRTLIGAGLFDFGHVNGDFATARLQHPLGLDWHDGGLVVADSYNGALRRLDLARTQASDLDQGFECQDPVCLPAGEPAGITDAGDGRLLVADTNNHRILVYRPAERAYRTWLQ